MTFSTSHRRIWIAFAGSTIAGLALALSGCNGVLHPEDFPEDGPIMTAISNPQDVNSHDFGHAWGLDVDYGTVACTLNNNGDPVLTFTAPDGTSYALNSVDDNAHLPNIDKITDGSIGTLRTFAFTVCDA